MRQDLVAVFDSGVDCNHASFGRAEAIAYEKLGGRPRRRLQEMRRVAIHGKLSTADIAEIAATFPYDCRIPASDLLFPGYDFAGVHPDYDLSDSPAPNIFDFGGHGTATAGILAMAGHAVLAIKVGYSLVPEISLPGLVEACDWLVGMVREGLPCTKGVWTFGSSDPASMPIYAELVRQLSEVGITIWASGRGALDGVESASRPLWPADIDSVIAVDEDLHLARYTIKQGDWSAVAYGLPGSTGWLDRQLDCGNGKIEVPVQGVTDDELRFVEDDKLKECVILVMGTTRPYVFRPHDEVFPFPVLVTSASLNGLPHPGEPATVRRTGVEVFRPPCLSPGNRSYGRTGMLAPAALHPHGWVPTFGASCAAPAAAAQGHYKGFVRDLSLCLMRHKHV